MLLMVGCAASPSRGVVDSPPGAPTGAAGRGLERFDAVIGGIIQEFQIPGAGLALVYKGRLVLARGYGLADVEAGRHVEPTTRFLLASVSKSLTAATVLKLTEEGHLRLDDKVFRILDDIPPPPGGIADPRSADITVRDLLYHAGGWNRRTSGDPMTFGPRVARSLGVREPITPRDLVRYMLGQPLDFTPGTRAVYSNYGYMLAGMMVARASGRRYAEYVQTSVLAPMGIRGMVEGAGQERYVPDEARRYDPEGRLDWRGGLPPVHFASGAWISSAVDMARFMAVIGGSKPPRFLSPATWQQMLAAPPPPIPLRPSGAHFGMGWDVVQPTPAGLLYHKDGGVLGTMTWVEHDPAGVDWVLLFNQSKGEPEGPEVHQEFQREIRAAIAATTAWPDVDLFDRFR
jgi:CubicO group peptidase (beta-lactamase class C family)